MNDGIFNLYLGSGAGPWLIIPFLLQPSTSFIGDISGYHVSVVLFFLLQHDDE